MNKIGSKIVMEGESEYRNALKNINEEQKRLRSEMQLATATMSGQQNSIYALTKKHEILSEQIATQKKKIELYKNALEASEAAQQKAAKEVGSLSEQYKQAQKRLEEMKSSSEYTDKEIQEQSKEVGKLKDQLNNAEAAYGKAENATKKWETSLNYAEKDLIGLNKEIDETDEYMAEASKSATGLAKSIDGMGEEVQKAEKKTSQFGEVLKASLATDAIEAAIAKTVKSIGKIADAAIDSGSAFEASMSQVAATMGMTAEEIKAGSEDYKKLEKAARECGETTKYSASEAAEALNYLALAGYDATKAARTLPKVLDLAAAGGLDLAYASDLVTDSMAALNIEVSELDNYIDEMSKTSQKSNTSIAQLGEATLVCAGTVTLTGQSLEGMNTELGILANNGIKGAEGGTKLRNILLSLAAPTESAEIVLNELGISIKDTDESMRDLNDIMVDLNRELSSMGEVDKAKIIKKIFNKTDIGAVNALLKSTNGEYDALYKELINCTGAAADMAKTVNDNLKGKVTILNSALESLGITAYDVFDDEMKEAVEAATRSVGRLQKEIEHGNLGVSLNKLAKGMAELCEGTLDFGENALPKVIDIAAWILDHGDEILSFMAAAGAGMGMYKIYAKGLVLYNAALELLKQREEGATVAQIALNVAMDANPVGLLVAAFAALAAGLMAYKMLAQESANETDQLAEASRALANEVSAGISERAADKASMEGNAAVAKQLSNELATLRNKTSLTVEEQQRMGMIVEQLNQLIPDLNLEINQQTGELNMSTEAMERQIDAMMRMSIAEAMQDGLAENAKQQVEVRKQLKEVQEKIAEQTEECTRLQKLHNKTMEDLPEEAWSGYETEIEETFNNLVKLTGEEERLQEALQNLETEYSDTTDEILATTAEVQRQEEAVAELSEQYISFKGQMVQIQGASLDTINAIEELNNEYLEAKDAAEKSISSQVALFGELAVKSEMTKEQMSKNLQSQTEAYNQYAADLETANKLVEAGILDKGLLAAIESLGIDGAGYMRELVASFDGMELTAENLAENVPESFNSVVESFREMEEARNNLADIMSDIETSYTERMNNLVTITQDDTKDMQKVLNESFRDISDNTETKTGEVEDIVKASGEVMVGTVEDTMQGMTETVQQEGVVTVTALKGVYDDMEEASNTKLAISDGKSAVYQAIGLAIPKGLAQGVKDGSSELSEAIIEMIDAATETAIGHVQAAVADLDRSLGEKLSR